MLNALALMMAVPGTASIGIPAVPAGSTAVPLGSNRQVVGFAQAKVRIVRSVRIGPDFGGDNYPGSQRRLILINAGEGSPNVIQAIEFE